MAFDRAATEELERLCAVPHDDRDDAWVERFYATVPDASLATVPQQVVRGPDGFPYFALRLPEPGSAYEEFSLNHVLDVCLTNGFGCVVVGRDSRLEWVFRYGNLWSYRAYGSFDASAAREAAAGEPADRLLVGSPSEEFLPPYARAVLRKELEAVGARDPGVLLVTQAGATPPQSLVFDVYPDDLPDEAFTALMHRLVWYLPPHYGLVSAPGDADWPEFTPL